MSKEEKPAQELEVVGKHEAEIGKIARDVRAYFSGMRRQAASMYWFGFLIGQRITRAKELLPHGQLEKWVAKTFPEMPERTIQWWVSYAKELKPKLLGWAKTAGRESAIVALLNAPKSKLTAADQKNFLEGAIQVMDGQNVTQFLRAAKLARQPEKQKHTPAKEVSAEEAVKMELAAAREMVAAVAGAIDLAVLALAHTKVSPADREEALGAAVGWTNALRECQKSKKGSRSTAENAKNA